MNLQEKRKSLVQYLQMKTHEEDWHGVSDAANDLRVLDCQIECAKDQMKFPLDEPAVDRILGDVGNSVDFVEGRLRRTFLTNKEAAELMRKINRRKK